MLIPTQSGQIVGDLRVLVAVEDDGDRRRLCQEIERQGRQAADARSAQEARHLVRTGDYDLAYVDVAASSFDGLGLIVELRSEPRTNNVPIVVISERDNPQLLRRAYEAGASAFVLAPLDWDVVCVHQDYLVREACKAATLRRELNASGASCRAREAIVAGACGEALGHARFIAETSSRALRSRRPGASTADLVQGLRAVEDLAVRLDRLIVDALDAVQLVADSSAPAADTALVEEIIDRAMSSVLALAVGRGVQIVVTRASTENAKVLCDPDATISAVTHLVRNAVTHAPAQSRVEIECRVHADGMLTIAVTDQGAGMAQEFVVRCLNPMSVAPGSGPPRSRIGVGLPLARAVAEAHGGKLEIRTSPGAGTCAMLVIPAERVRSLAAAGTPK